MDAKADSEDHRASAVRRVVHQRGSLVHLDEWVAPDVADDRGFLRAGKVLEWMDVVGVVAATRHCRMPVVTASVDGMVLRDPIRVGEHVTMSAAVGHTSERSMGVSVWMTIARPDAEESRLVLTAFMSFVALGDDGTPSTVPQLVPETPAEMTRFREGSLRREFRQKLEAGGDPLPLPPPEAPSDRETSLVLKALPRGVRFPWDRAQRQSARGRGGSYVHTIEPVRSGKLNFHGTLYGGTLMRWIETNASLSARAYMGGAAVRLAGLHGLTFLRAIRPNRFVHIQSVVVHTGPGAVTVLVSVQAENPLDGEHEDTLRAFFTYAPAEGSRSPAPVVCDTDDERTVFEEVERRLALQRMLEAPGLAS
jgi:acyl-CoA hydrolase